MSRKESGILGERQHRDGSTGSKESGIGAAHGWIYRQEGLRNRGSTGMVLQATESLA